MTCRPPGRCAESSDFRFAILILIVEKIPPRTRIAVILFAPNPKSATVQGTKIQDYRDLIRSS
jgi:hypothetical protein